MGSGNMHRGDQQCTEVRAIGLFDKIQVPNVEDFPEMDAEQLALADDDVNLLMTDDEEEVRCTDCVINEGIIKKMSRKIKALEASKKTLQKLNQKLKVELIDSREVMGKVTKENVATKEIEKTKSDIVEVESEFECDLCEYEAVSKDSLKRHMEELHKKEMKEKLERSITCKVCKVRCFDSEELEHHMSYAHKKEEEIVRKCGNWNVEEVVNGEFIEHQRQVHGFGGGMYLKDARCQEGWLSGGPKKVQEKETKEKETKEMCRFFLEGRCTRQMCPFSHENKKSSNHKVGKKTEMCRRGDSCPFQKQGNCNFVHAVVQQLPRDCDLRVPPPKVHQRRSSSEKSQEESQRLWCQLQDRCLSPVQCPFRHFQQEKAVVGWNRSATRVM